MLGATAGLGCLCVASDRCNALTVGNFTPLLCDDFAVRTFLKTRSVPLRRASSSRGVQWQAGLGTVADRHASTTPAHVHDMTAPVAFAGRASDPVPGSAWCSPASRTGCWHDLAASTTLLRPLGVSMFSARLRRSSSPGAMADFRPSPNGAAISAPVGGVPFRSFAATRHHWIVSQVPAVKRSFIFLYAACKNDTTSRFYGFGAITGTVKLRVVLLMYARRWWRGASGCGEASPAPSSEYAARFEAHAHHPVEHQSEEADRVGADAIGQAVEYGGDLEVAL